ncbi:MAG: tRNA pseudouridine synthase B [Chlamydiae bacterium]|nr:tRNA pseudouridine synthase B [Chlamydiota bacterium]
MTTETKKHGILLINKPKSVTSFSLIPILRKLTNVQTIGHAGTLDPFATGVMVYLVGKEYTKTSNIYLNAEKHYMAVIYLGIQTDTFDIDGQVISENAMQPTYDDVLKMIAKQQGIKEQIPPMFSAKKYQGRPLYHLARKGITVERKPQIVKLKTTLISYNYPYIKLYIECSKGTYVRTIADEIGQDLTCGAHLFELTRTQCGPFTLKDCDSFEDIKQNVFQYMRK